MFGFFGKKLTSEEWCARGQKSSGAEACECYKKAIDLDPMNAEAWSCLGSTIGEYEQSYQDAKRCFERAVEIKPNYIKAWRNLMILEKEKRNDVRAVEIFNMLKSDLGWGPANDRLYALAEEIVMG